MREDDVEIGELGGHVVDAHRVRVLEADAASARHAGTDAGGTRVKQRDQTRRSDHVVQRIPVAVVGPEGLGVGVELEATHAGLDQLACFADRQLALVRVDAPKRDQDVWIGSRDLQYLIVAEPPAAHTRLVVDGEYDGEHAALAVVIGYLLGGRLAGGSAEVLRCRSEQLTRDRVLWS